MTNENVVILCILQNELYLVRFIGVMVFFGIGQVFIRVVDIVDVYRLEGIFDVIKIVKGILNLINLMVDKV